MEPQQPNSRFGLQAFYERHWWIGAVGSLASVIAVPLAVYFFVASQPQRELTYFVHPARTVLVQSGATSRLSVSFDGKPLHGNATALQLAIWNAGDASIRSEQILDPVIVATEPSVPILEARIRKRTRQLTGIQVDGTQLRAGKLRVSWDILEHGDGAVIQLIVAGDTNISVGVVGAIEGQSRPHALEFSDKIRSPTEQYASLIARQRMSAYSSLGSGAALLGFVVAVGYARRRPREFQRHDILPIVAGLATLILGLYQLFSNFYRLPPFGF